MGMRLAVAGWIEWALTAFGRVYVKRWEIERVACTRTLISMIVCWQLGSRRTRFTIKTFGADVILPKVVEGEAGNTDKVEEISLNEKEKEKERQELQVSLPSEAELNPDDDELDPEVQLGPVAGKRIVARWRGLLLEMMAVCSAPVVVMTGIGFWWWRS